MDISKAIFNAMSYEEQQQYIRNALKDSKEDEVGETSSAFRELDSDETSDEDWLPPPTMNRDRNPEESDIDDVYLNDVRIECSEETDEDDEMYAEPGEEAEDYGAHVLYGKDKTRWKCSPPQNVRMPRHNILRHRFGPARSTQTLSIRDTFKCFLDSNMCDIIIRETNRKARSVHAAQNVENPENQKTWRELTVEEFDAYLGILITAGVHHSNSEHARELWQSDAYPIYRAAMGINRFKAINRFIRFDNPNSRPERIKDDKAAAISDLFIMLNANLASQYVPTDCITIDEQLFPFRGRTKFTQYMPSKPAKYGIKVWWACDAKNSFPLQGQIYTGKTGTTREINQGERVVRDLCLRYKGTGRNIVTDNFFTSLPLARFLMAWELSLVGTLKKNKGYIPPQMLPSKSREVLSTIFGFNDNITICSYVQKKKNKAVVMLSTLHRTDEVSGSALKKPEIIDYYNRTKGGVDTMDKMLATYSTKRRTLRWPVAFFYNMLDVAALAAYIVFMENNPACNKSTDSRRSFLKDLGKQLALPAINMRSETPNVYRNFSTRNGIESVLGHPINNPISTTTAAAVPARDASGRLAVVGNCHVCMSSLNKRYRKSRKSCIICNRPICNVHAVTLNKCSGCN